MFIPKTSRNVVNSTRGIVQKQCNKIIKKISINTDKEPLTSDIEDSSPLNYDRNEVNLETLDSTKSSVNSGDETKVECVLGQNIASSLKRDSWMLDDFDRILGSKNNQSKIKDTNSKSICEERELNPAYQTVNKEKSEESVYCEVEESEYLVGDGGTRWKKLSRKRLQEKDELDNLHEMSSIDLNIMKHSKIDKNEESKMFKQYTKYGFKHGYKDKYKNNSKRSKSTRIGPSGFSFNNIIPTECSFCPSNEKFNIRWKPNIIATSTHAYVAFQSFKECVVQYELIIAPVDHIGSSLELDENIYTEIRNFQKSLLSYMSEKDICMIFVESRTDTFKLEKKLLGNEKHLVIRCFGIQSDRLQESKAYFKKSLMDIGSDWGQQKKCIDVPQNSTGCRDVIPPHFPYFYVDFSLSGGMIHIIESSNFPKNLGKKVIQGMIELDETQSYYQTHKEYDKCINIFRKEFQSFNWVNFV